MTSPRLAATIASALSGDPTLTLVVLHGSQARGDARPDSDVDLLVQVGSDYTSDRGHMLGIAQLAQDATGRVVELAELAEAIEQSPALVLAAIDEGVAVVDRDQSWDALRRRREELASTAANEHARRYAEMVQALERIGLSHEGAFADEHPDGLTRKTWMRIVDVADALTVVEQAQVSPEAGRPRAPDGVMARSDPPMPPSSEAPQPVKLADVLDDLTVKVVQRRTGTRPGDREAAWTTALADPRLPVTGTAAMNELLEALRELRTDRCTATETSLECAGGTLSRHTRGAISLLAQLW